MIKQDDEERNKKVSKQIFRRNGWVADAGSRVSSFSASAKQGSISPPLRAAEHIATSPTTSPTKITVPALPASLQANAVRISTVQYPVQQCRVQIIEDCRQVHSDTLCKGLLSFVNN